MPQRVEIMPQGLERRKVVVENCWELIDCLKRSRERGI